MRTIPAAMRTKLLNRFKSQSTESEPKIRVVSTQSSSNILMTEPIHEDELPAFGDVAMRQTEGDDSIALAYAACIDDGILNIYRRTFPAMMDYEWTLQWTYGAVEDVALEYDGEWEMDAGSEYYFLRTEEFPYLFTIENGDLYVQKWRDTSSRILLAEDVEQISACKGFKDSIYQDNDQGLIIGYIRQGEVFYRTLAYSTLLEEKVWEIEQQVTELGDENDTLAVVRLNDFRIGFLTEQDGQIKLAVTKRTYPGMSIQPEGAHTGVVDSYFTMKPIKDKCSLNEERAQTRSRGFFLMADDEEDEYRISVTGSERTFGGNDPNEYCTGVIVYLDRPLLTVPAEGYASCCACSNSDVTITNVVYDSARWALVYSFAWKEGITPHRMILSFQVTIPNTGEMTYETINNCTWYFPTTSVTLEAITNNYRVFENESACAGTTESQFTFAHVDYRYGYVPNETAAVGTVSSSFSFIPIGDIPV